LPLLQPERFPDQPLHAVPVHSRPPRCHRKPQPVERLPFGTVTPPAPRPPPPPTAFFGASYTA
jgi:hypothetical protein